MRGFIPSPFQENCRLQSSPRKGAGFTVFELLIVMGIFALIIAVATPVGITFYLSYQFDSESNLLTALLRHARNLSMVNYSESDHGLHVLSDKYVVFEGASYATRIQANDKKFPRDTVITLTGPTELVFAALSGQAASSTFSFSGSNKSRDIFVNPEGLVYE